jgi:hypothetical protein
MAATAIAFLLSACSDPSPSGAAPKSTPTPLPSGLTLVCTDRYLSQRSEGPIANGKYVHFVCQDGKVTSWWIDDNNGTETAPPG